MTLERSIYLRAKFRIPIFERYNISWATNSRIDLSRSRKLVSNLQIPGQDPGSLGTSK